MRLTASHLEPIPDFVGEREGWDRSRVRAERAPLPWMYPNVGGDFINQADRVLDLGTGGGELLLALATSFKTGIRTDMHPEMIEQARQNRAARWHAFDFESGLLPDGTYGMQADATEREHAGVILIEGAYAAGPALADLMDLSILVDVPLEQRHARLRGREDRGFLETWHKRWDPVESHCFKNVRPKSSFDLVARPMEGVPSQGQGPWQP